MNTYNNKVPQSVSQHTFHMGFHQVGVNSSSEADCVNATAERRVPAYSNVKDSSVASVFNMGDIVVGVSVEDGMGLAVGVVVWCSGVV